MRAVEILKEMVRSDFGRAKVAFGHLKARCSSIWIFGALLLVLTTVLFLNFRVQHIASHSPRYIGDEYHTVYVPSHYLQTGELENYRVPEGSRWVFRALFPLALIKMNQMIGGDHFTEKWNYAGLKYFNDHYPEDGIFVDPGIQDFFIALRTYSALLLYLSFLPLIAICLGRGLVFTPLIVVLLLGASDLLLYEQTYFYSEPIQLAALNLLLALVIWLYDKKTLTVSWAFGLGVLVSFVLATKISGVFAILVPAVLLMVKAENTAKGLRNVAILFAVTVVGFCFWNYPAFSSPGDYARFLNDTTSNFWHYAVGHRSMDTTGLGHYIFMVDSLRSTLGFATLLIPFAFVFGFFAAKRNDRWLLVSLALCLVVTIVSIAAQRIHVHRNLVPWMTFMVFVLGFSMEIFYQRAKENGTPVARKSIAIVAGLLVVFWLGGALSESGSRYFTKFYINPKSQIEEALKGLVEAKKVSSVITVSTDLDLNSAIPKEWEHAVPLLNHGRFKNYQNNWYKRISDNHAVVVQRVSRNFQLTNFILPRAFKNYRRFGNYFIFWEPNSEFLDQFKVDSSKAK